MVFTAVYASWPPLTGSTMWRILSSSSCRGHRGKRISSLPDPGLSVSIHFARSHALLVSKLRTLPEMRAAAASMNAILNELPLHVGYCAQWGISEQEMATQPEAPETINYTRYVLDIGHSGDALDLLVALMPCVAGYAEIGLGLLQHPATRLDDNPYASWIRNYGDEGYLHGVNAALALLETVWQQRGSEARITELSEIFTTATRLEAQFWQMGLNATAETRA